jgi:hypothetical protein
MHTTDTVFVAVAALYLVSTVLPVDWAERTTPYLSMATGLTGAIATFFTMSRLKLGLLQTLAVMACAATVTTLTTLAMASTTQCADSSKCYALLPLTGMVFSSAILSGAAAYFAYLLASAVGLPLWAAIVTTIVFAPVFMAIVAPAIDKGVKNMLNQSE